MRQRLNGFLIGILTIIAWAVLIFKDIIGSTDRLAYMLSVLKELQFLYYVQLLGIIIFTLASLIGRRLSAISGTLLFLLISCYFYFQGLRGIDGILFVALSFVLLIYAFCSGLKRQ